MRRRTSTLATTAAAALTLLVAACGDGTGTGTQADALPPKIRLTPSAMGAGGAETSSRMMVAEDSALAGQVEFVLGGKLPGLDDAAASWSFVAPSSPVERIEALAVALGVEGDVVARSADQGGGWIVGPEDGSGPSLMVSGGALGDWWYNPGTSALGPTAACEVAAKEAALSREAASEPAVSSDQGGGTAASSGVAPDTGEATPADPAVDLPACPEPVAPTGVPSEDEARRLGLALLDDLGVEVDAGAVEVQGDEWGRTVTAWLTLDGLRAPIASGVSFGGDAQVVWANGYLGTAERGPDYPRAGTAAGVERLQQQWAGMSPLAAAARDGGAATDAVAPAPNQASVAVGEPGTAAPDDEAAEPAPEATEPPATTTLTITGVEPALWMVWNSPEDVWLVPAYTFTTDDGGAHTIVAVADEFLEVTAPDQPVSSEDPTTSGSSSGSGSAAAEVTPEQAARLVGLSEDEAARTAEGSGWGFRVVERDGEDLARTDDYRTDRVNAHVDAGIVIATDVG